LRLVQRLTARHEGIVVQKTPAQAINGNRAGEKERSHSPSFILGRGMASIPP
jgi:hypothetical protein